MARSRDQQTHHVIAKMTPIRLRAIPNVSVPLIEPESSDTETLGAPPSDSMENVRIIPVTVPIVDPTTQQMNNHPDIVFSLRVRLKELVARGDSVLCAA